MKNQRGFSVLLILAVLLLVSAFSLAGYFVYKNQHTKKVVVVTKKTTTQPADTTQTTATNPTDGWKEWCSTLENACFKYPTDWALKVNDISSYSDTTSAESITLTSPKNTKIIWNSPISGLGGNCEPDPTNIITFDTVTPSKNVSGVSIARLHLGQDTNNKVAIGYTDSTMAKVGNSGQCMFYFTYKSKAKPENAVMFYANTIDIKDEPTVNTLLESLYYKG